VCGTDHSDYGSECELRAARCTLQKHIELLHHGHCGQLHTPLHATHYITLHRNYLKSPMVKTAKRLSDYPV